MSDDKTFMVNLALSSFAEKIFEKSIVEKSIPVPGSDRLDH